MWTPIHNFPKTVRRLGRMHRGDILGQSIIGHRPHRVDDHFSKFWKPVSKMEVSPQALLAHRYHFLSHWMTDRGSSDLSSFFSKDAHPTVVGRANFSQPSPPNPFSWELGLQHRSYGRGEPSLLHLRDGHVWVKGAKRRTSQRRGALVNFLLPQSPQA